MKPPYDFDVIVVGSGPGGCSAAVEAAKMGKKVAIIERKEPFGGAWVHKGAITAKLLRSAILSIRAAHEVLGPGAASPAIAGLSMPEVLAQVEHVIAREREAICWMMGRNAVTLLSGQAEFLEPHTMAITSPFGDKRVTAAFFVLAPGSTPKRLPSVPFDGESILDSDEILELKALPKSVIAVGAGIIGVEYANMFAALGVRTTLVDRKRGLLEFVDRELVQSLQESMGVLGVIFRLGDAVESVIKDRRGSVLANLAGGETLSADAILFCTGRQGNTNLLKLPAAGVGVDDRGRIVHDEYFRTHADHIYAVGNVIGFPALASTAMMQGRLAAHHLAGREVKFRSQHIPYALFTIPELSMVGYTEEQLRSTNIPYEVGRARFYDAVTGQIINDSQGMLKLLFRPDTKELLGVHSIGSSSAEIIHIGQAVMELGGTLEYFKDAVFNSPTVAESYRLAALDGLRKAG